VRKFSRRRPRRARGIPGGRRRRHWTGELPSNRMASRGKGLRLVGSRDIVGHVFSDSTNPHAREDLDPDSGYRLDTGAPRAVRIVVCEIWDERSWADYNRGLDVRELLVAMPTSSNAPWPESPVHNVLGRPSSGAARGFSRHSEHMHPVGPADLAAIILTRRGANTTRRERGWRTASALARARL